MDRHLENLIEAMPLPTEADRKRAALIGRLARALEDMSETLPSDHPVRLEAVGWKDGDITSRAASGAGVVCELFPAAGASGAAVGATSRRLSRGSRTRLEHATFEDASASAMTTIIDSA